MAFFNAEGYERLMGRWSQRLASRFLKFAEIVDGDRVLDVGTGTGALSLAVLAATRRAEVVGIDLSGPYIDYARSRTSDTRARFEVGDAQALPYPDASFNKTLALLMMNFIPDARKATAEMRRVTKPGGIVAAAVWDYDEGMTMLRIFWDAALALDPTADLRHERQMPYSRKGELFDLWSATGLEEIKETSLVIPMAFESFEDFWQPFLSGQGLSGAYAASLSRERQGTLRERLRRELLGAKPDMPFSLPALAWALRGIVP